MTPPVGRRMIPRLKWVLIAVVLVETMAVSLVLVGVGEPTAVLFAVGPATYLLARRAVDGSWDWMYEPIDEKEG